MGKELNITKGVIWKQLLIFFFPIMIGSLFQQLYSTVDAIIVGRFVGKEALAAVGNTGVFINLLIGFFMGISSGAGVVIAQFFGAKEDKGVSKTVHTSIILAVVGGAIVMVAGILAAPTILQWMNTPGDIFQQSYDYTKYYFYGAIPCLVYNIGTGILRAIGDSKRPLYFLIVACFANIVLDFLFVVGFDMGVIGAAIATDLAQCLSAILVIVYLMKAKRQSYQLHFSQIKLDPRILKSIIRIGIPIGVQSIMYTVSNMIIQGYINDFGTDTIAAWTAYGRVDFLFWMIVNAMGIAVTTFAGQNFGAGKLDRMKQGNLTGLKITALFTLILSSIYLIFAHPFLLMFTGDEAVLKIGVYMIRCFAPIYITFIPIEIYSGTIRGAGTVFVPTLITTLGVCGLRIVWLGIAMKYIPNLLTLMAAYPIAWIVASSLYIWYYHKGRWIRVGKRKLKLNEAIEYHVSCGNEELQNKKKNE